MRTDRYLLLFASALASFLVTGCGDPLNRGGKVSGKVTIDGEPVTAGNVLFQSEDGKWNASGPLRGDGTYEVDEPPLGRVQIAVQTLMYRGQSARAEGGNRATGNPGSAGMVLPDPSVRGLVYKEIPGKYEELRTSGLTHVITHGDQTFDIPLTWKE
jgi:hypothetical protein